ncbi:unnamed protein product [Closterium sp. Naga37s-1]|nr:unnamed protein product [Closterium sp. Naga37s-1]
MAASSGLPFNPFNGVYAVNGVNAVSASSDALRVRPPTVLSCSLSHGLSLSLLSSLTATWQHGRHRLRASTLSTSQSLDEPSWKKAQSGSLLERFPLKAAATASGLALAGDTLAQLVERRQRRQQRKQQQQQHGSHGRHHADARCAAATAPQDQHVVPAGEGAGEGVGQHDWVRAVRMASYGFLLYGPGCHAWYRRLDRLLPAPTAANFALKVLANQVVVGPTVLLVVFAWNMAWMGKARDIPDKYRRDFFPSLIKGYKFWIPATCLNFAVVPLEARVAFMSCCAIFWNFHLSSSLGKEAPRPAPQRAPRPAAPLAAPASSPDDSPAATTSAGYQVLAAPSA